MDTYPSVNIIDAPSIYSKKAKLVNKEKEKSSLWQVITLGGADILIMFSALRGGGYFFFLLGVFVAFS